MVSLMGGTSQSIDKNKRHPKATEKGVKKSLKIRKWSSESVSKEGQTTQ